MTISRIILVVLDGAGAGAAPDAAEYGDAGAATLTHVAESVGGLRLPNLERLGLGHAAAMEGISKLTATQGAHGRLRQRTAGKDTITGWWELAGLEMPEPFATFPDGFPPELVAALERETGRGVLGNRAATEAEIFDQLGEKHLKTGQWIVYTSSSSVLSLAAHQDVMGSEELYAGCRIARRIADEFRISRVIARPFKGPRQGRFNPAGRHRDFTMAPAQDTVLDKLSSRGVAVAGIGRVDEIFAGRGLTERLPAQGNTDAMIKTVETMTRLDRGLVATHLDDFDSRYGHARDPAGFARCLEEFDVQLAMLLSRSLDGDLVLLTADHGNDPTRPGNGHTRELVPILVAGLASAAGVHLGTRSFADVGATIADVFGVEPPPAGESFLPEIS